MLGEPLEACCFAPRTGYYRDGYCRTDDTDRGRHVVCAQMTAEFLAFTQSRGNDLSTPQPAFGFPGLIPGDRWCLCVQRWKEAYDAGVAPPVLLAACDESALAVVPLDILRDFAVRAVH